MKVSFLYTLSTNQALFAPYIATLITDTTTSNIRASHHVNEELLQDARQIAGPEDEARVKGNVHKALSEIVEQEKYPDIIVCTCSTIGDMAETYSSSNSDSTTTTKVLRVDRFMAMEAVNYANIHVLAGLESTVQPTLQLLQECATQKGVSPTMETTVVPNAWSYFQAGDPQAYVETIAKYILDHYYCQDPKEVSNDLVLVLAQASMSPAAELVVTAASRSNQSTMSLPRVLTSPGACMEYLSKEFQT